MSTITVEPELVILLKALNDQTEIRDSEGQRVGVFTPQWLADQDRLIDKASKKLDMAKAKRVLAAERDQGITTEEMLKKLP